MVHLHAPLSTPTFLSACQFHFSSHICYSDPFHSAVCLAQLLLRNPSPSTTPLSGPVYSRSDYQTRRAPPLRSGRFSPNPLPLSLSTRPHPLSAHPLSADLSSRSLHLV